jgi:RHS repeat-associated protein
MKTTLSKFWRLWVIGCLVALMTAPMARASGTCTCARFNDWHDLGCHMKPGGNQPVCDNCHGLPRWWVDSPYITLHVTDIPLSYRTSSGQEAAFQFHYKQRFTLPASDQIPNLYSPVHQLRTNDPYIVYMHCHGMTNFGGGIGAWGHNWMMDIMFWDQNWDQSFPKPAPVFSTSYEALVFRPEGGIYYLYRTNNGTNALLTEPQTQTTLQPLSGLAYPAATSTPTADTNGIYWGDATNGFRLIYPDGSQDLLSLTFYTYGVAPSTNFYDNTPSTARALLTQRIDPQGRVTRIGYEQVAFNPSTNFYAYNAFRVRYVVDPDGRTNKFSYQSAFAVDAWQLSEVDDPYGRKTTCQWASGGSFAWFTSIIDAAGNSNNFDYVLSKSGLLANLITPYGTNSFGYAEVSDGSLPYGVAQRAIYAKEADGSEQLYCYIHNNTNLSATETSPSDVPGQSFDDGSTGLNHPGLNYRNTFHWGPRQFTALSSNVLADIHSASSPYFVNLYTVLNDLTGADYNKASLKHWLWDSDGISITEFISSERDPSIDAAGLTVGQRTWYNYANKPYAEVAGYPQMGCTALLLPDGTSQYQLFNYFTNSPPPGPGLMSDTESSYSLPGGTIGARTNWFQYAANEIDLSSVSNSAGQFVELGYNTNHQIISATNSLGQVSTLSWDASTHNLTNLSLFSGQSINLSYYPANAGTNLSGLLTNMDFEPQGLKLDVIDYTAALPRITHSHGTAVAGLWLTNSWDGLNRLTSVTFPDQTTISNVFTVLDLTAHKDRLGNWTSFGYDPLEHLTSVTNALTNVTQFTWCGCGALTGIIDALTNTTTLNYNNQGLLTNVVSPDATVNYQIDLAGRITGVSDGSGRSWRLFYNNQGLVTVVSNSLGVAGQVTFDSMDRPFIVTDANGVTVTNKFDLVDRLLVRTWTGAISEGWLYATNGLIASTNRDQKVTHYGRDGAGRLTSVTNANQEVVRFGLNAASQIITLIDGLNHTNTWNRNEYGWVTNKVDALGNEILRLAFNANGWLTNRWLPATGNTGYGIDAVGNLLSIAYSGATNAPTASINFGHDKLNRLTSVTDAVGVTTWTYLGGLLQSETAPWTSNTLSYLYSQGVRTNMALTSLTNTFNFGYAFDQAWRMQSLASPAGIFGYTYSGISPLVRGIALPNFASISNHFDSLARMDFTGLQNYWGHTLDGYSYGMDSLGLRTNITRNLGLTTNSVSVGYDLIGQITSWLAKESTGTPRMNEQIGLGFDAADNLHFRTNGGFLQTFTVDADNELSSIARTGTLTVSGATPAPATNITVNGVSAQIYGDLTFASTNNSLVNGTNTFTVLATNLYGVAATNTLTLNLLTNTTFSSDANGNLTSDGVHSFLWNGENQMTNVYVPYQWKVESTYDGLGRRRIERDYIWQSGAWVRTNEFRFIYDGMLLTQVRDSNNIVLITFTRGLDLSGSLAGAGGIGGLLAMTQSSTNGPQHFYYHSDGAGNVTALMDGIQNVVARYGYDPFGRLHWQSGAMAQLNQIRFSSKWSISQAEMYDFGYRWYLPIPPRWLSRDPIGEAGGINLYSFVGNSPSSFIDPFGLAGFGELHTAEDGSSPSTPQESSLSLWYGAQFNGEAGLGDLIAVAQDAWGAYGRWAEGNAQAADALVRSYSPGLANELKAFGREFDQLEKSGVLAMVVPEAPESGLAKAAECLPARVARDPKLLQRAAKFTDAATIHELAQATTKYQGYESLYNKYGGDTFYQQFLQSEKGLNDAVSAYEQAALKTAQEQTASADQLQALWDQIMNPFDPENWK